MSWKDALNPFTDTDITKDKKVESNKKKETVVTTFPTSDETSSKSDFGFGNSTPIKTQVPSGQVSQEYIDKFLDAYENAFNELNQSGYDFFEFFQSVINGDINNSQTFTMAFAMGKGMDKSITKEKLLSQSEFYTTELSKLYDKNCTDGTQKKQQIISQKDTENQNLISDLDSLKLQLEGIKVQIKDRENKLSQIENKYQPKIIDWDNKLLANDFAKNKIISSIEAVKQGINKNIK